MDIKHYNKPRNEWVYVINEWVIGKNAERDRDVLISHLLDGVTYEKLAEKHGIEPRTVGRIIAKRMENLISHI